MPARWVLPFRLATTSAWPTARAVTLSVACVWPAGTSTSAGTCATPGGWVDRATRVSVGWAALSRAVSVACAFTESWVCVGSRLATRAGTGVTCTAASVLVLPRVATTSVWPVARPCTGKLALRCPVGTTTCVGRLSTPGVRACRGTVVGVLAVAERVSVSVV